MKDSICSVHHPGAFPERQRGAVLRFQEGIYVTEVTKNGPAETAGIKESDIITQIDGTQLKAQQRLEQVNSLIEEQKLQKQIEEGLKENYTEETRKEFIEKVQNDFIYGKVTKDNIDEIIDEARKYPNFNSSLIDLLDIKSRITGNRQEKIDELEKYVEEEYSITPEEYSNVLDVISETRNQIKDDQKIENYLEYKKKEEREGLREQREYSKNVIEELNKGKITKENY